MKKKLSSKKCIALILAVVMIFSSIPFMMVGAEDDNKYDPAPYFDETAVNSGADAWVDDDGNVQVTFPAATPKETFKGEATNIAFYILELIDMGAKDSVHQRNVLKTIKATGTSATFKTADIGTFDFENKRIKIQRLADMRIYIAANVLQHLLFFLFGAGTFVGTAFFLHAGTLLGGLDAYFCCPKRNGSVFSLFSFFPDFILR